MSGKQRRVISTILLLAMAFFLIGCDTWGYNSSNSGNFKVQDYQPFSVTGGEIVSTHIVGVPFNVYVFLTDDDRSKLVSAYQTTTFTLLMVDPNGSEKRVGDYTIQKNASSVGPISVTATTAGQWRIKIAYNLTDNGAAGNWSSGGKWHENRDNHGNGGNGRHYGWGEDGKYQQDPDHDGDDDSDKDFAVVYSDYFTVINPVLTIVPDTSIMYIGTTVQFSVSATTGYVPQNHKWSSSDPNIAQVANDGTVTAKKVGTTVISVVDANGIKATRQIQVLDAVLIVSPQTTFVLVNRTVQYSVSYSDNNKKVKSAQWSSSNPAVATVSGNGLVTGISTGEATITVQVEGEDKGKGEDKGGDDHGSGDDKIGGSASIDITVTAPSISPQNPTLYVGYPVQFTVSYYGGYQPVSTPVWSVNNTSIAAVDANGVVTGIKPGTVTLTVTGDQSVQASTTVTVKNPATATISPDTNRVFIGVPVQYSVTYTGIDPGAAVTKWTSTNTAVATVNDNGLVTGLSPGISTITVKDMVSGASDFIDISVVGVTVVPDTRTIIKGNPPVQYSLSFTGGYQPGTLTWQSSNTNIATVDANGKVTGQSAGTCTITVRDNSGVVVSFDITVKVPTASISGPLGMSVGDLKDYTVSFTDGYEPQFALQWTTSPVDVAGVLSITSKSAVIQGLKAGSFTLTLYDQASGATASLGPISVVQPAQITGITITPSQASVTGPGNASFQAWFVWSDGSTSPASAGITWGLTDANSQPVDSNLASIASNGAVTVYKTVVVPQVITVTANYQNLNQATATLIIQPKSNGGGGGGSSGGIIWRSEE